MDTIKKGTHGVLTNTNSGVTIPGTINRDFWHDGRAGSYLFKIDGDTTSWANIFPIDAGWKFEADKPTLADLPYGLYQEGHGAIEHHVTYRHTQHGGLVNALDNKALSSGEEQRILRSYLDGHLVPLVYGTNPHAKENA